MDAGNTDVVKALDVGAQKFGGLGGLLSDGDVRGAGGADSDLADRFIFVDTQPKDAGYRVIDCLRKHRLNGSSLFGAGTGAHDTGVFRGKGLIDRTARGGCIDVLRGFPKAIGILQAVRTLSPQVVVCDEVGSGEEVRGLLEAVNCGVSLLASIHAGSMEQLLLRPQFHALQQSSTFEKIVLLQGAHAPTAVETVYKVQGERLVEI